MSGVLANAYGQIVVAAIQLAGIPILLHCWGARLYGEWVLVSAVPAYLSMVDLGFAQSAGNDMAQQMGMSARREALAVFQSIGVLVAVSSLVALIAVVWLAMSVSIAQWLPLNVMGPNVANWVLLLLAADILIKLNDGTLHAGFRANGGYALHTAIYNSTLLIQYVSLWCIAAAGGGPLLGATGFLLVRVIALVGTGVLMVRMYPWLPIGCRYARMSEVRRLVRPAVANIAFPLGQALSIQGMTLAVGAALGPVAVAVFSSTRTLTRLALQAVRIIGHAGEPEIAAAYGKGDLSMMRRIYVRITQVSLGLSIAIAAIMCWWGEHFLVIWTGGRIEVDQALFDWLLFGTVAGAVWYGNLVLLKAANQHIRIALFYDIASALGVALAFGLMSATGKLGYAGVAALAIELVMIGYAQFSVGRICGSGVVRQLFSLRPLYSTGSRWQSE